MGHNFTHLKLAFVHTRKGTKPGISHPFLQIHSLRNQKCIHNRKPIYL